VLDLLRDYGLDDFYLELSTKPTRRSSSAPTRDWEEATEALRQVAEESGLELVPDPGGAAFYGPKISVQAKDAIGRTWQMSTIQLDFNLPERFELEYTGADGSRQRPVMIHRALFGSIERFFGVLTEHYAGAFPAWLAPVQVVGIPIADAHADYLHEFAAEAAKPRASGSRSTPPTTGCRRRSATPTKQKVPFMLIAGDEDVAGGAVSFRYRDGSQRNGVPLHRPDRPGDRRAGRADEAGDDRAADRVRGARLQHRHEPGHGRRRRHRRPPAPAHRAPLGRRHQLHARGRAHAGAAPTAGGHTEDARGGVADCLMLRDLSDAPRRSGRIPLVRCGWSRSSPRP
jgi:hypothetical protein